MDGVVISSQQIDKQNYEVVQNIEFGNNWSLKNSQLEIDPNEIGQLEFDDGTEWWGDVGDFE